MRYLIFGLTVLVLLTFTPLPIKAQTPLGQPTAIPSIINIDERTTVSVTVNFQISGALYNAGPVVVTFSSNSPALAIEGGDTSTVNAQGVASKTFVGRSPGGQATVTVSLGNQVDLLPSLALGPRTTVVVTVRALTPTPTPRPATPTPRPATSTPRPATSTPRPATSTPRSPTPTPSCCENEDGGFPWWGVLIAIVGGLGAVGGGFKLLHHDPASSESISDLPPILPIRPRFDLGPDAAVQTIEPLRFPECHSAWYQRWTVRTAMGGRVMTSGSQAARL